ncbi:MAG: hypothetical protein OEZ37_09350, partial [Gemmatimonadota bacterium]|nr:hypothetical protein [Gemmatimonadota bacterium]
SVEIVLPGRRSLPEHRRTPGETSTPKASLDPEGSIPRRLEQQIRSRAGGAAGSGRLNIAPLVRAGAAFGDALAGDRPLGREDRTVLGTVSIAILVFAAVSWFVPTVIGWTVATVATWFGMVTGTRAYLQARRARADEQEKEKEREASSRGGEARS